MDGDLLAPESGAASRSDRRRRGHRSDAGCGKRPWAEPNELLSLSYMGAAALLLVISAALPTAAFFKLAHSIQVVPFIKNNQVKLAAELEERRQRAKKERLPVGERTGDLSSQERRRHCPRARPDPPHPTRIRRRARAKDRGGGGGHLPAALQHEIWRSSPTALGAGESPLDASGRSADGIPGAIPALLLGSVGREARAAARQVGRPEPFLGTRAGESNRPDERVWGRRPGNQLRRAGDRGSSGSLQGKTPGARPRLRRHFLPGGRDHGLRGPARLSPGRAVLVCGFRAVSRRPARACSWSVGRRN